MFKPLTTIDATTTTQDIYNTDVEVLQDVLLQQGVTTRNMTRQQIEELAKEVARKAKFALFGHIEKMQQVFSGDNYHPECMGE